MALHVNLKLLQTFSLVAEHSSFRRAAEEVFRSQSAVSMQIKQLEAQLGVPLFHRTTRRVELTPEGEQLLACTRRASNEIEAGLRQIREAVDMQRGHVTIACAPTIAATRLPDILAAFQRERPAITVSVRERAAVEMLEDIRHRDVDFGIGPLVPMMTDFDARPILSDEVCVILPPGHDSSRGIRLQELDMMPVAMLTGLAALRTAIEQSATAAGITLNVRYEVMQPQTLIAMARAGLAAAIVPRIAIPDDDKLLARTVSFVDPPIFREIAMITYRGQAPSPIVGYMAKFIEAALAGNNPDLRSI